MIGASFAKASEALVTACLAATANVWAEVATQLQTAVQALNSTSMADETKS